jgi:hypothetical protein
MGWWVFMSTPLRYLVAIWLFTSEQTEVKYLMFAVQLLPVLLYIISTNRVQNKGRSIEATFVHVKYPSICVHESQHFSAIKLLIFYKGKYNSQ